MPMCLNNEDFEKELCRSYDEKLDWFADELIIQPESKSKGMIKTIEKVSMK